MDSDDVIKAFEDGSMHSLPPQTLRDMLRASTQISGHNPTLVHKMSQSTKLIRDLLATHETRQQIERTAEEARAQHQAVFALGSKTLRWTIVAAAGAIVGAIAALIADIQSSKTTRATSDLASQPSSPQTTAPKFVSPAPAAGSSTSTPATTPLAAATPLPKTP